MKHDLAVFYLVMFDVFYINLCPILEGVIIFVYFYYVAYSVSSYDRIIFYLNFNFRYI